MQLKAGELKGHLARSLAPLYLVHGDEPLLCLEAADAIRAAARARGFAERQVLEAGRSLDWSEFAHAAQSRSLFGEKKLLELRLPGGKPAAAAAQAIVAYARAPNPDVLLLVTMPRPEGPGWWKADWFLAVREAGAIVEVEPVPRARLQGWLAQRLAAQGHVADPEALEFIADRVEGNLLAAHQELQKLALLVPAGPLSAEAVRGAVASVARYDPDAAAEALLAGDASRYARTLEGLRAEGEAPNRVVSLVASALFVLRGIHAGQTLETAVQQQRFYARSLQPALGAAARRYRPEAVARALVHAARADRAVKGVVPSDAWDELLALGLELQGRF